MLADIRALESVDSGRGNADTTSDTFHAIRDVGRWWP
jgi:hypothetical protein